MKDDDKKPLDNNAVNQKKNRLAEKNRQAGKTRIPKNRTICKSKTALLS